MAPHSISTPAKINLYLDVLGRRMDGYHDISTLFVPLAGLADTVSIDVNAAPAVTVSCNDSRVPCDERNLCVRAARAFAESARVGPHWHIDIVKRIPVAAGLGGGSSNAAGVLRLLNSMHGEPKQSAELADLARPIGADVPFFLQDSPALATGIGDILTPVCCPANVEVVLVNPGFPISTAWSYATFESVPRPPAPPVAQVMCAMERADMDGLASGCYNALEHVVLRKFPILRMLIDALTDAGCLTAHVSGSGPTVYGICAPGKAAGISTTILDQFGKSCWACYVSL